MVDLKAILPQIITINSIECSLPRTAVNRLLLFVQFNRFSVGTVKTIFMVLSNTKSSKLKIY